MPTQAGVSLVVKKAFDRGAGLTLLALTSPVLVGALVATRVTLGKPAIYSQLRPGHRGKLFRIYKIRTMTDEVGPDGALLPDSRRITSLGRILRSTSIDELPQLLNVVRGELSLVGPRPLLPEYLERYSREQARRHDVLPGITGWAQIHGRNAQTWQQRFALDVWYVDNWSLRLDVQILLRTLLPVLRRSGVTHGSCETMPKFRGDHSTDS